MNELKTIRNSRQLPLSVLLVSVDDPPCADRNRYTSHFVQLDLCAQNDGYRNLHPSQKKITLPYQKVIKMQAKRLEFTGLAHKRTFG